MAEQKAVVMLVLAGFGIAGLLILILVPMSFSYMEFYHYGFKKARVTGEVNLNTVYGPGGRHMLGPLYTFKTFQADAHFISFDNIAIFTSDKLEVKISADLQYFLKQEDLPLLHKQYDIYYKPILETNAQDALKGAATVFSKNEYIKERKKIEKALFDAVRGRLGGTCCLKDCAKKGICRPGCTPHGTCKVSDKGMFAEVRYFQLRDVDFPRDVWTKYVRALVLNEETAKEQFVQNYTLVQKQTDQEVKLIDNEAAEIAQNATAQAQLLRSKANAQAAAILENARSSGLKLLYDKVKITQVQHKSSFDYLRTLKDMSNAHLSVDFDQLIAGNIK